MGKAAHLSPPEDTRDRSAVASEGRGRSPGTSPSPTARPPRPPGRAPGQRGARARRDGASAQPTTGAGPVPAASLSRVATLGARVATRSRSGVRSAGAGGRRAPAGAGRAQLRRGDRSGPGRVAESAATSRAARRVTRHRDRSAASADGCPRSTCDVPELGDPARRVAPRGRGRRRGTPRRSSTCAPSPSREVGADRGRHLRRPPARCSPTPTLLADVKQRIGAGARRRSPRGRACLAGIEREWAELPDPYLRERAADVRAVGDQVLRALAGAAARSRPSTRGSWSPAT